ncbi:hypothetical protein LCGC14_2437010, partial [marine sediment metagenome]
AEQAFDTDEETMQMSVATFYFDSHVDTAFVTWTASVVHNYPTLSGTAAAVTVDTVNSDIANGKNIVFPVMNLTPAPAVIADIEAAAIWCGLLVNAPGTTPAATPGGAAVPTTEKGPYLNEFPKSSSTTYNGNPDTPGGAYTWVIAVDGKVWGVTWIVAADLETAVTDGWYAGFNGTYP